jgi:hypothetical protein
VWSFILHHLSPVTLALGYLCLNCRPRQIALLIAVMVGVIGRDDKRSRAERAVDIVHAICRNPKEERRPDRKALPPGSSP